MNDSTLPPHPGKRPGQKYKSLLVLQYLFKNADDENAVTMNDILSHLSKYGIESDRRSIYRDIHGLVELLNAERQEEADRMCQPIEKSVPLSRPISPSAYPLHFQKTICWLHTSPTKFFPQPTRPFHKKSTAAPVPRCPTVDFLFENWQNLLHLLR